MSNKTVLDVSRYGLWVPPPPRPRTLGQRLSLVFAMFWKGGDGPSHAQLDAVLRGEGLDPAALGSSKQEKVSSALTGADEQTALDLATSLAQLLHHTGQLVPNGAGPAASGRVANLRSTLAAVGATLTDDGTLAWRHTPDIAKTSGATRRGSPARSGRPVVVPSRASALPAQDVTRQLQNLISTGESLRHASFDAEVLVRRFRDFDSAGRDLLRRWPDRGALERFDTPDGQSLRLGQLARPLWAGTVQDDLDHKLSVLGQLLEQVQSGTSPAAGPNTALTATLTNEEETEVATKVFVVHGHDELAETKTVRLLERALPTAEVIVLHEQASQGDTVIEKLERYGSDVAFAVVLLTGDDVCTLPDETIERRARQNVVLELGWFLGKIGRKRVCALLSDGVTKPSDYAGVVYTPLDGAGAWRSELLRELHAAGLNPDYGQALR